MEVVHGKSRVGVMLTHPQVGPFYGRGAVRSLKLLDADGYEFQLIDATSRDTVGESKNGVLVFNEDMRHKSFEKTSLPYTEHGINAWNGYCNLSAWPRLCVVLSQVSDTDIEYTFEQEWSQLFKDNRPVQSFVHNLPAPVQEAPKFVPAKQLNLETDFKDVVA